MERRSGQGGDIDIVNFTRQEQHTFKEIASEQAVGFMNDRNWLQRRTAVGL